MLAALIADIATACPAVCDARPELLADLAACEAATPAAARCMRAYMAYMSPETLTAVLASAQPDDSNNQVRDINSVHIFAGQSQLCR